MICPVSMKTSAPLHGRSPRFTAFSRQNTKQKSVCLFPKADAQKAYITKIQQTRNHTGSSGITLSSEAVHQSFQQVSWLTDQRSAAPSHAVWHNGLKQHLSPLTVTGSTQDSHLIPFYPCIVGPSPLNLQGTENWKYSIANSIIRCHENVNFYWIFVVKTVLSAILMQ